MHYVNLGRSGLKVSRLCLGCMSYGEPQRLPQPWSLDENSSRPLIRQALESGINFLIRLIFIQVEALKRLSVGRCAIWHIGMKSSSPPRLFSHGVTRPTLVFSRENRCFSPSMTALPGWVWIMWICIRFIVLITAHLLKKLWKHFTIW